jgi:ferredoxin
MNRFITEKDFESAQTLLLSEIESGEIFCAVCPGYCENACRRKKIDLPVSIRNIQLYIFKTNNLDKLAHNTNIQYSKSETIVRSGRKTVKLSRRFNSHIGKLEAIELSEWLKECSGKGIRFSEISESDHAVCEAENCMHCDCRASNDCRLRDLAEEFLIKDPRGKLVNSPIIKKINHNTGLIFENAKCIKCGLCVRLCENSNEEPALCFINRGFISIISEPLTEEFDNILKTKSKEVIEICPTGALSQFK